MSPETPKQFLHIDGRPVLAHSINAFLRYDPGIKVIIVLPRGYESVWKDLSLKHNVPRHIVAEGGPTRFHSVKSGLMHADAEGLLAIHDGVRPLVSQKLIGTVFELAEKTGNAIPAISPLESVRQTDQAMSKPLPREKVRLVQTPQCFRSSLIINAYNTQYDERFTDDACVMEKQGERLFLVEGDPDNIKITTQSDLIIADALLKQRKGMEGHERME